MYQKSERKPPAPPSMIDELLGRTRHFLTDALADGLRRSVDGYLRWILGCSARYVLSAALFIMAAAFLLLGGAEGLIESGLPRYLAHLTMGGVGVLVGLLTLKCRPRPSGRE